MSPECMLSLTIGLLFIMVGIPLAILAHNKQKNRLLVEALKHILSLPDENKGRICREIEIYLNARSVHYEKIQQIRELFTDVLYTSQWPHHSGNERFPIPETYVNGPKPRYWEGRNKVLRQSACNWVIKRLS